jgi:hypothetical protein
VIRDKYEVAGAPGPRGAPPRVRASRALRLPPRPHAPRPCACVPVRVGRTSGALRTRTSAPVQPGVSLGQRTPRPALSTLSVYYRCRCRLGFRQLEAIPNAMFTFGSDERLSPTPTRRAAHLPPRCSPSERAPAESSLRALARSFAPHSCRRSLGQRLRTGRREIQHRQAAG